MLLMQHTVNKTNMIYTLFVYSLIVQSSIRCEKAIQQDAYVPDWWQMSAIFDCFVYVYNLK